MDPGLLKIATILSRECSQAPQNTNGFQGNESLARPFLPNVRKRHTGIAFDPARQSVWLL